MPIFKDFMAEALKGTPDVPFRIPPGVNLVRVNHDTGQPAKPGDRVVILEAFRAGTGPTDTATLLGMGGAAEETGNARGDSSRADASLDASVARRLQELLSSLGLRSGDRVKLEIDAAGDIRVADSDAGIGSIEAALNADPQLADDLRRLARSRSAPAGSPFGEAELRIEVGESDAAAGLTWR